LNSANIKDVPAAAQSERLREGTPIVSLTGVHKSYTAGGQSVEVLRDVSLHILTAEAVAIRGVSGSGKSTLLNIIGAIDTVDQGEVAVCGARLDGNHSTDLVAFRRNQVGFIFQFYNLLPTLNVFENVMVGLEAARAPASAKPKVMEYLDAVGLTDKMRKFPEQLSGGEQQRVAIARALAKEPPLVLADEPTGSLDEETGIRILALLNHLQRERNLTIIVVTHNPAISEYTDRTLVLHNGKLAEAGG
jgi:putative ABC transport system ATP-binding protein